MKRKSLIIIFVLMIIAQLTVATQIIVSQELIVVSGNAYKFKTRPVDPYDPFRGNYVILSHEMNYAFSRDSLWDSTNKAYLYLNDSLGYAQIDTLVKEKRDNHKDYIMVSINWVESQYSSDGMRKVYFDLPFDKFYMNEYKSKAAESLLQRRFTNSVQKEIYSLVYIKDGKTQLNDLLIDNTSISEYLDQN